MKLEEIIKLLDAGYTRDEINALHDTEEAEKEQPAEQPAEQQAQPGLDPTEALVALLGKMDKKITEIQAMNILSMQQPGAEEHQKTEVDVLSELMHPDRH